MIGSSTRPRPARCTLTLDAIMPSLPGVVLWDLPAYPERFAARLARSSASPYLPLADTLPPCAILKGVKSRAYVGSRMTTQL